MTHFLIRRALLTLPTLLGVTLLVFLMVALSPGGVAGIADDASAPLPGAAQAQRDALAQRYGLNDPVLVQYGRWLTRLSPVRTDESGSWIIAAPDLGTSFSRGRPVAELIGEALPVTLLVNALALLVTFVIAVPTGLLAAVRAGRWFDRASGVALIALWSIPTVWAAVLAVVFLASSRHLGWFPVSGLQDPAADAMPFMPTFTDTGFSRGVILDALWHLCLPVLCLSIGGLAILAKQVRGGVLDQLSADHIRTARSKGLPERDVVLRHAGRASLPPLLTMFASIIPALLAGSIVVERVFALPGMGTLILAAIESRDRELLMANTLVIGVVAIVASALVDVLVALADPRISHEKDAAA